MTRTIAERWGVLDGERQLAGWPLNTADGMIAATALEQGITIVYPLWRISGCGIGGLKALWKQP